MFGPEAPYERGGDINESCFLAAKPSARNGDTIHLYYGAADSCVALATGSIRCLLSWLDANSGSKDENNL